MEILKTMPQFTVDEKNGFFRLKENWEKVFVVVFLFWLSSGWLRMKMAQRELPSTTEVYACSFEWDWIEPSKKNH